MKKFTILLMLLLAITACKTKVDHSEHTGGMSNPNGTMEMGETVTYRAVGAVQELDTEKSKIKIKHEDIEGLMPAMTMAFDVRDKNIFSQVKTGDNVVFWLESNGATLTVTEIEKAK
ncbi:MAG: copper-binding protein [Acidobacteriota bacterium]|nr:copper-binding protein [Acidobacteriota bacterium]